MKIFKLSKNFQIVANYENRRDGFAHRATLLVNGNDMIDTTVKYLNRTWERYSFQTVMVELVNKALKQKIITKAEFNKFYNRVKLKRFLK